jgi:hypothetical protein
LTQTIDSNSVEHLLSRHYRSPSGEELLPVLKRPPFKETRIRELYEEQLQQALDDRRAAAEVHVSLLGGLWMPQGAAGVLGNKVQLGGALGWKRRRLSVDLMFLLRFLKARQPYRVKYEDSLYSTDQFFGGYVGGEFGFECFDLGPHEFSLTTGAGYDGFEALDFGGDDYKNVNSFNVNVGLRHRVYYDKYRSKFFGLQFRYNIVGYTTHGGSDLSGNTLSVNFIWGYSADSHSIGQLKDLRYYD